jgi:hypothetical protein
MRAADLQGSLPEKLTIEPPPGIAPVADHRPEVKATNTIQVHATVPEPEPVNEQTLMQTSAVDRLDSMKYIIEYNRNLLRKPKLPVREKQAPTKRIESESEVAEESQTTVKPASKGPRKPPGVTLGQSAISQQVGSLRRLSLSLHAIVLTRFRAAVLNYHPILRYSKR